MATDTNDQIDQHATTVVNVTNATLKGSVKGPTFTGNVDGATFTGSVTYTDTTTPPVEPPTGEIAIPEGRITNFNASSGSTFNIAGVPYFVESPNKSWSLQKVDDRTLRFEVRSGDRFTSSWWSDPTTSERSEVGSQANTVPASGTMLLQHRIMWEPGSPTKTSWNVFSQMHEKDVSNSPPYALELINDKLAVNIGTSQTHRVYQDTQAIVRGRWYTIQSEARWDRNNGFLKIKRDGVQIVNYTGALGTGVGHYLKFGIYRYETPETIAVQYRDVTLKIS